MKHELRDTWTPAVNVLTWFMLVVSILSVLIRLSTKLWIFRKLTVDDVLSIGAMVTCIAQSIAISMATAGGLGQHWNTLSVASRNSMMKVSSDPFHENISSRITAQFALSLIVRTRGYHPLHRLHVLLQAGLYVLRPQLDPCAIRQVLRLWTWGFYWCVDDSRGLLGSLSMPGATYLGLLEWEMLPSGTWGYTSRSDTTRSQFQVAWFDYLGATNILSEAGIIAQVLLVIVRVQADLHKKITLASVFLLRIVYVPLPSFSP